MRIIFFGSGEFGLSTLRHLHDRHDVVAVVSQPDRPAGRRRRSVPTPITKWAQDTGLPLFRSADVNALDFIDQMRGFRSDAGVIIAFGQKLGEPLIEVLGRLAVNLHASLLPKYRGAAPINWAVINGEKETGVSVISLAPRMDAGLVFDRVVTAIEPLETAGELHDRLSILGPDVIEKVLHNFQVGLLRGEVQVDSRVVRAPKLSKADGRVDFNATADEVRCRINGLSPWPGVQVCWALGLDGDERPLRLLRAASRPEIADQPPPGTLLHDLGVATGRGVVHLLEVQIPGGRPMAIDDFARGHPLRPGDILRV